MSRNLAKNLIGGRWLMEAGAAAGYLPVVHSILTGRQTAAGARESNDSDAHYAIPDHLNFTVVTEDRSRMSYQQASSSASPASGSMIAVIDMKDPIVKYNEYCGPVGTEAKAAQIRQAASDPRVAAIILDIDSPGGSGDAVQNPSAAIREARKKKPVVAYVGNGMAASAAYWIASNADEIYATFESDQIGSIGSYITMVNYEKFLASYFNTDVVQVYASKSTEKNKGYRDAFAEKPSTEFLVENDLDPFNEIFINTVRENRPSVKDSAFTGRLFMAAEAIDAGLIDGMKSFEETIERAMELAEEHEAQTGHEGRSNNNQMFEPKKIKALAGDAPSVAAVSEANAYLTSMGVSAATIVTNEELESLRSSAEGASAMRAELDAVSAAAGFEGEGSLSEHVSGMASRHQDEIETLNSSHQEQIAALNARIVELGGAPAAGVAAVKTAETEEVSETSTSTNPEMEEFYNSIDSKLYK